MANWQHWLYASPNSIRFYAYMFSEENKNICSRRQYDNLQQCQFYQTMAGALVRVNILQKTQIGKYFYRNHENT